MGTQNIYTKYVQLRKYVPEDAVVLYEMLGMDPEITKYTGWNPYDSLENAKKTVNNFIKQYEKEHFYGWAIEADGNVVGTIGAYDYNEKDRSVEIGYSIGRKYWGKGYATEAVILVCYYLEQYENILRIHAWTHEKNIASQKVLEKAGMEYESRKEDVLIYTRTQY